MTKKQNDTPRKRLSPAVRREAEYLHELKNEEPFHGWRVELPNGSHYKVRIIARGEQAFYQEDGRAVLFEISAAHGIILESSIRRWDDGSAITKDERDVIIQRVGSCMTESGDPATYSVR